jgi:hypothetical protein
MPKTVLLDEWHVTFRIPAVISDADVRAVRRILNGKAFTAAVRRAVLAVVRERPVLKPVRLTLGR